MFTVFCTGLEKMSFCEEKNLTYEGQSINNESDHGMGCMSDSIEGIM